MEQSLSAREANQNFSAMLRRVKDGHTLVITSHGTPVAKVSPVSSFDQSAATAQSALWARLESQRTVKIGKWKRDELYTRGHHEDRS